MNGERAARYRGTGFSEKRQSQLEQFERDESGPRGAGDKADWNGRNNECVPHDLNPQRLEGTRW